MEKGFAEKEEGPLFSFGLTPEFCYPGVFESLPIIKFLPPDSWSAGNFTCLINGWGGGKSFFFIADEIVGSLSLLLDRFYAPLLPGVKARVLPEDLVFAGEPKVCYLCLKELWGVFLETEWCALELVKGTLKFIFRLYI